MPFSLVLVLVLVVVRFFDQEDQAQVQAQAQDQVLEATLSPIKRTIARERLALMELMDEGEFRIPRRELEENILIATWKIQMD